MRLRFNIPAKLIVGVLANTGLLALGFLLVFRSQFGGLSSQIFTSLAEPRAQVLAERAGSELRARQQDEWTPLLDSYEKALGVKFSLLDGQLRNVAGRPMILPSNLLEKIRENLTPHQQQRPDVGRLPDPHPREEDEEDRPPPRGERPPPPGEDFDGPPGDFHPPGGRPPRPNMGPPPMDPGMSSYPKVAAHTSDPSAYWVVMRVPAVKEQDGWHPLLLVVRSETFTGGGLFFDPKPWLYAGAAVILISALIWFPLALSLTRSLRRIRTATARIAEGDFAVPVPDARRSDELGDLGRSIHQMAQRLESHVSSQKRFLGDVAHELCSPVARMQASLGILEQNGGGNEKQNRYLDKLGNELQHISALVNELLNFSKATLNRDVVLKNITLASLIHQVLDREDAENTQVEIPADLKVRAEPELLSRAIGNLVRNSLRYAGEESSIEIRAIREGSQIKITVADRGPGVPQSALAKLFEPFYRPDAARTRESGGTGLGLAIVKSCIEACQGSVTLQNRRGGGLEASIQLAAAED